MTPATPPWEWPPPEQWSPDTYPLLVFEPGDDGTVTMDPDQQLPDSDGPAIRKELHVPHNTALWTVRFELEIFDSQLAGQRLIIHGSPPPLTATGPRLLHSTCVYQADQSLRVVAGNRPDDIGELLAHDRVTLWVQMFVWSLRIHQADAHLVGEQWWDPAGVYRKSVHGLEHHHNRDQYLEVRRSLLNLSGQLVTRGRPHGPTRGSAAAHWLDRVAAVGEPAARAEYYAQTPRGPTRFKWWEDHVRRTLRRQKHRQ